MRRTIRSRLISKCLPIALAAIACGAWASTSFAAPASGANLGILSFSVESWPAVQDLQPDQTAFDPPYAGGFDALGLGVRIEYLHRFGQVRGLDLYLGGEFAGYFNEGSDRYAGTWAGTGQPVTASLFMNSGYLLLSGRLARRAANSGMWFLSYGLGAYLLVAKDDIEGMLVETGTRDVSFGGYGGVGFSQPFRAGKFRLEIETRVHGFDFHDLEPGFPGQSAGGPMFEAAGSFTFVL
jgi:hypothetical protein